MVRRKLKQQASVPRKLEHSTLASQSSLSGSLVPKQLARQPIPERAESLVVLVARCGAHSATQIGLVAPKK